MRARIFWIAFPLAFVLTMWLGSGLARDDVSPQIDPVAEASEPHLDAPSIAESIDSAPTPPECEPAHDPGPDGDR